MSTPATLPRRHVTLLDLVDRILEKGVVLSGDITLAVADVDLVHLNLQAFLASVETESAWRIEAEESR